MALKGLPEPVVVCEVSWQPIPPVQPAAAGGGVQFRMLGPVEVAVDTTAVEIGSAKQRALLAMLVLHHDSVVSADVLIDALWAGDPPPTALPTLRTLVARLRRALTDAGVSPHDAALRGRGAGYLLQTQPYRVDAVRFGALLDQGRAALAAGNPDQAANGLREALGLWRGPAIGDLADWEFAQIEARRLDELRLAAIEELSDAELRLGHPAQALARLEPLVQAHPLRERGWGQLMLARYRLGRQAEALVAYHQLRTILADELGIEPTPAVRELRDRILRQVPDLDRPPEMPPHRARDHGFGYGAAPGATVADVQITARHNLPATLTRFIGRARELAELDELLAQTRLLTLTGVGGVGKTRLALRCAATAVPRYPDGVRFVEFGSLRDPALVVPAATTAIGFLPSELDRGGQPLLEALCQRLATRRLLLVLDNCEHLVEPISTLAHTLLACCPQLTVLATSREVLGVTGEVVFPVAPFAVDNLAQTDPDQLAASDAVRLFCDRARAARPGFALTPANAEAVALICQRLDGIALALELAAARIRGLGAHKLADRLTERLRLLATGPRTTAPRHQTLRAAIDWSYQLLPPAEQAMLAQLSVFPGSFDLDAAEAIVDVQPATADSGFETLDLLTRLVDKSLIVVATDPEDVRYRLLETIREYASEKLHATGAHQAAHRRHRDFFRTVAESYPLALAFDWAPRVRRAAAELDNFRAALTWSLDHGDTIAIVGLAAMLWPYWQSIGGGEGLGWLEHAVAALGPAPLSSRVQVRLGLAMALRHRGTDHISRGVELCEEALAIAREGDDLHAVGHCNIVLADLAIGAGELARAEHFAREAHAAFQACGSSMGQGWSHLFMGWPLILRGEYTQANEHLEAALKLGPLGDWLLANVLATQALLSALTGRTTTAEHLALEGVRVAHRLPACDLSVMALTRATQAAVLSERMPSARGVLTDLLELLSTLGFQRWVADALELTAIVLATTDPARAAAMLGAAGAPRELLGESTPSFMSDQVAGCRQRTAAALGAQRYAEHEQDGRNNTIHEALALAMDALRPQNRTADAAG